MAKKILIVDDNEKNRKLIRVVLKKKGYETLEAADGEEGVTLAREALPDLIIMDVRMPAMDGVTAVKILKADPRTAGIPVIMVTSSAMKGDRERVITESGCDSYITKPIDMDSFFEIVGRYTGA